MNNIGNNIQKLRISLKLTQDKLAEMIGVSNSAVSKWELGLSYPDTSILSALAKALDTDLNTLFSFREKLDTAEILKITNEVRKEIISNNYDIAVSSVKNYIIEYPKDDTLLLNLSSQLLLFAGYDDPNSDAYKRRVKYAIELLSKLEESNDISIVNQSKFLLSTAYSNLEEYTKSKDILTDLAKSSIDTDIPLLSILLKEVKDNDFIDSSSIILWQSINKVVSVLDMTSMYTKKDTELSLKYINLSIDVMNIFKSSINFAYYSKCRLLYKVEKYEESALSFKQFANSLTSFPLDYSKSDLFSNVKLSLDSEDQEVNRINLINIYLNEDLSKLIDYEDYNDAIKMMKDYVSNN